jgi:hypothetical protein
MTIQLQITTIAADKVLAFPAGVDFIHMQISLAAGAIDYRALEAHDVFPVFSLQFDPIIGGTLAATGSSIVWDNQLIAVSGKWWNVFAIENKSDVDVSVIVQTKSI